MDLTDAKKSPQPSSILPFPVENSQPRLSIKIENEEIGFLYKEYYSLVFNRCFFILRNKENAEDAAHDVFEKIQELNAAGRFHTPYPKTYLSAAALNMSINKKRRARKELEKIYDMATGGSIDRYKAHNEECREKWEIGIADNGYDQIEAKIIVDAILKEQDETTRRIYFYKYHDDMTLEQIGEVAGLRKSAVHKRIKKLEEQVKLKMGVSGK